MQEIHAIIDFMPSGTWRNDSVLSMQSGRADGIHTHAMCAMSADASISSASCASALLDMIVTASEMQ